MKWLQHLQEISNGFNSSSSVNPNLISFRAGTDPPGSWARQWPQTEPALFEVRRRKRLCHRRHGGSESGSEDWNWRSGIGLWGVDGGSRWWRQRCILSTPLATTSYSSCGITGNRIFFQFVFLCVSKWWRKNGKSSGFTASPPLLRLKKYTCGMYVYAARDNRKLELLIEDEFLSNYASQFFLNR